MLLTVKAGPYTMRGLSVAGLYTSLQVPELNVALDVGVAPRSFAGVKNLFLSHGHPDHAGALPTLLGIRALMSMRKPLRLFVPTEITAALRDLLAASGRMQGYEFDVDMTPMAPGDELALRADLWVRAFRTHHPVPSLGYHFFRRVRKLRPEFVELRSEEIAARRRNGEDEGMFDEVDQVELSYATDTLACVLDDEPDLLRSRVLVVECTFLDERKSHEATVAGKHTHLDDLLEYAARFENEHIVLMHFSQIYKPGEVTAILRRRCPPDLFERIVPFAPTTPEWPG